MTRPNRLIKFSGDTLGPKIADVIGDLSQGRHVVLIPGGGTQITKALKEAGLPVGKFLPWPLGREVNSFAARLIAEKTLKLNQLDVQEMLAEHSLYPEVIIPVIRLGSVDCPINGDLLVLAGYHGFDDHFVITTAGREEEKRKQFAPYPKIQVIGI